MNISYNAVMWAGLSVLMAGVTTVSAVTLYKHIQQEKKLEKLVSDVESIDTNNHRNVEGLTNKLNAQLEEQKKANKKNNAELVSAKKELSEAQEALDSAKVVYKVVKEDLPLLLDTLKANQGGNVNVDINKWSFVAGPGAPAPGAGTGVKDKADLCDKIAAAMKNYTGSKIGGPEAANDIWGRLTYAIAGNAAKGPVANYKSTALDEAKDRLEIAEKHVKEARAKVIAIEAALD